MVLNRMVIVGLVDVDHDEASEPRLKKTRRDPRLPHTVCRLGLQIRCQHPDRGVANGS